MEENNGYRSLKDLPYVVLGQLSHYLNIDDVKSLSETCRSLRMQIIPTLLTHRKRSFQRSRRLRWHEESPMGLGPRYAHCMVYCESENSIYLFGGSDERNNLCFLLQRFCLRTRIWSRVQQAGQIPELCNFARILCQKKKLIVFGLPCNRQLTGLYVFDLKLLTWEAIQLGEGAVSSTGSSCCILEKMAVFYSGIDSRGRFLNQLVIYNFETRTISTVELINAPPARFSASLCALDTNTLLLIGGEGSNNVTYMDSYQLDFDEHYRSAIFTSLIIDTPEMFPPNVYSNTSVDGERVVFVAKPLYCSVLTVSSIYMQKLHGSKATERFFDVKDETLPTFLCLQQSEVMVMNRLLYPKPSNTHQFAPATTSFEHTAVLRFASYIENDPNFLSLLNQAWEDSVRTVERLRDFTMFSHDFFSCLYWLCSEHAASSCNSGTQGSLVCFKAGGCIEARLRQLYHREDDEFILSLLKTMWQLVCLNQRKFPDDSPYPPLKKDIVIKEKPIVKDEYPLERLLELQTLVPVHRAIIDAPLTSVFYTVDLHHVRESRRVRFVQQPVPFNAPLFQQYAPVIAANYELFTCGGVDPVRGLTGLGPYTISDKVFSGN